MEYRRLGNTGLDVSVVGLGCEGMAEEDFGMCKKLLDEAEKLGVNYFDVYGSNPELRSAIGNAIKGRREKFIIQSHICSIWKDGQYKRTRDLEEAKTGFAESLELFGTDYIDVGMIHYCDAMKDWEEIVENGILDYARELKAAGVIKHIGLSSHNPLVALRAIEESWADGAGGAKGIEVLMFSINPCYDLQPASEEVEDLWADETYTNTYTNMDPDRQKLYEVCQSRGIGVTVMKAFAGGDLLNAELSPAGVALTENQCIGYALSRPGVSVVLAGAHSVEQLRKSAAYCDATEEERDYAVALATFPRVSWVGHCIYCSHCAPCPMYINIADVTKFMHLAEAARSNGASEIPETVREHYKSLEHHASECIECGSCETRCPFSVEIRENMKRASEVFGY